jgi:integrase/recombinase XerD
MQGKQAKIISLTQERAILGSLATTRSPTRDRVMLLLSMKAGLRAKAMAALTWAMVTDAQGQVAEVLHVPNRASKRKTGGRTIPLHPDLQAALDTLQTKRADMASPERPILCSERGGGLSPATVRLWLHRLSTSLKMHGCSSEFISIKSWAATGEDEPGIMEGTAAVPHQSADVHLPEAASVFDAATTLDPVMDMVDPQPTLVDLLVRHGLLPRALLPQIEINSSGLKPQILTQNSAQ